MKKKIALLLSAVLCLTMILGACSGSKSVPEPKPEEPAASEASPTEQNSTATDEVEPMKIGFAFNGVVNSSAWLKTLDNARIYVEENCENVTTQSVENVMDGSDVVRVFNEFINDGCRIVVGTSFSFLEYMLEIAAEHPEVVFLNASGYDTADNLSVFIGRLEDAKYLEGMVAGSTTESNMIGYCSSMPFADPVKQVNAFALGVKAVNPDAKVHLLWSNSFYDPATDRLCANTLIDQGCDVITQDLDSSVPVQTAEERGVWAIASHYDMSEYAPTKQLTATIWEWGPWVAKTVEEVRNGTFKGSWNELTFADGAMRLAAFNDAVSDEIIQKVEETKELFKNDEKWVFEGPIYDNEGNLRVAEGETLKGEDLYVMDWLVDNVVGSVTSTQ